MPSAFAVSVGVSTGRFRRTHGRRRTFILKRVLTRRDLFLRQAAQAEGRSPLYGRICRLLADEPRVDAIIESPPRWDAALRLLAGLHHLVLERRATWDDIGAALDHERTFLQRFVAEETVQTNEVQRAWMFLPCFLDVARRTGARAFDLVEVGTSAGLLLLWDRYRYRYEEGEWGLAEGLLGLAGEERRRVPAELLAEAPRVLRRVGIDLKPLDLRDERSLTLLKSFVWADQHERLERLDRAAAVFRRSAPSLVQGDFVDLLPGELSRRRDDALTVVLQSAAAGYLTPERRAEFRETLERAGAAGPLAYVTATQPATRDDTYYGLVVQLWPGGERHEVAHADFHGAWIEWHAR